MGADASGAVFDVPLDQKEVFNKIMENPTEDWRFAFPSELPRLQLKSAPRGSRGGGHGYGDGRGARRRGFGRGGGRDRGRERGKRAGRHYKVSQTKIKNKM